MRYLCWIALRSVRPRTLFSSRSARTLLSRALLSLIPLLATALTASAQEEVA